MWTLDASRIGETEKQDFWGKGDNYLSVLSPYCRSIEITRWVRILIMTKAPSIGLSDEEVIFEAMKIIDKATEKSLTLLF